MRPRIFVPLLLSFIFSFFFKVNIPSPQQFKLSNVDSVANLKVRTVSSQQGETGGAVRSNRNTTGSWIGNTWIPPPPWRLYSASETRRVWANKKVWWLGDSTARRGAFTFYHVISNTDSVREVDLDSGHIIDVNKNGRRVDLCPSIPRALLCRPMPDSNDTSNMSFVINSESCAFGNQEYLQNVMNISHNPRTTGSILDFDIIVIAMGAWEVGKEWECQRDGKIGLPDRIIGVLRTCHEFTQKFGVPIVWRTSGYGPDRGQGETFDGMNNVAMDMIDSLGGESGLTYINWGGAVRERSFGPDRILGDHQYHYGVHPRLVLMQMLTNHLVDRGVL